MDHTSKLQAETVFVNNYPRRPPPNYNNAFRPANNDHLLIQPKKLINPVLESRNHRVMQEELKLNSKLGIDVLHQKSELNKVFLDRQRNQFQQENTSNARKKSEFELMIEKRYEETENASLKIKGEATDKEISTFEK